MFVANKIGQKMWHGEKFGLGRCKTSNYLIQILGQARREWLGKTNSLSHKNDNNNSRQKIEQCCHVRLKHELDKLKQM